jgi:DNA-binding LacI/PurR family transcriptional regulator
MLSTLFGLAAVASGAVALGGRGLRGVLRVRLTTVSILAALGFAVATMTAIVVGDSWGRGDLLSLIGLAASAVGSFLTSEYLRGVRRLKVAIVIPSMRPFHTELRRGLVESLDPRRYRIQDPYAESDNPEEDLSSLLPTLLTALRGRPDVMVICAPAVELAESEELIHACESFAWRGGHVIFVESVPQVVILERIKFCTTVVTDSEKSAELVAMAVESVSKCLPETAGDSILVVPGPRHSRPAVTRVEALRRHLADKRLVVESTLTWTATETERIVASHLARNSAIRIICAGNDDMARGAAQAIHRAGRPEIGIVGHDGIYEAIVAISDPFNPLAATVRVPPKAYGQRAASLIESLPAHPSRLVPWLRHRLTQRIRPGAITVPLSRSNIVTADNAQFLLYGQ